MLLMAPVLQAPAQQMRLGEVLVLSAPVLKSGADTAAYEAYLTDEVAPAWRAQAPGPEVHLFRADRGARDGAHLIVWTVDTADRREAYPPGDGSPFPAQVMAAAGLSPARHASYVEAPGSYTDYVLVGADQAGALPGVEILGIHAVAVRPGREAAFEAFVRDTLYQAFRDRMPGLHLLYYRGVRGEQAGSYLALFALESVAARELYWPTGAPETEALAAGFRPLRPLGLALSRYLVEGSYLEPSSGAAGAYFESTDWTDFVHVRARPR
jgi:hypothetical protein